MIVDVFLYCAGVENQELLCITLITDMQTVALWLLVAMITNIHPERG